MEGSNENVVILQMKHKGVVILVSVILTILFASMLLKMILVQNLKYKNYVVLHNVF